MLFLCAISPAWSQDYFVLQVKGQVKRAKTGTFIKTRDVIRADEQISFSSSADAVAVVNAKSGRFIIKPGPPTKTNELLAYVKDALTTASTRLSTREGGFNNALDIQAFFSVPIYFMPELRYKVNKESFPISEEAFFFIRYLYNGEEINKQLLVNSDNMIIINRSELFKIDGKSISEREAKDFQLLYYNSNGTLELCPVTFELSDPEKVKNEIAVLMETLKPSQDYAAVVWDEVLAYLKENYAKADRSNLQRWIEVR
jgi:hypothetical protein